MLLKGIKHEQKKFRTEFIYYTGAGADDRGV